MWRLLAGIAAAPVLWGMLSVPINLTVASVYGTSGSPPTYPRSYLLLTLALSCLYSLCAGYGAAWIAGRGDPPLGIGAGLALLAVGLGVQLSVWDTIPVWYHVIFLALLVPLCAMGARFRG
jgi:hypothetical protein